MARGYIPTSAVTAPAVSGVSAVAGAYRIDPTNAYAPSNGTDTGANSRYSGTFARDAWRFRVAFPNWANGNITHVGEIPGANPITVRAALEYPAGQFTPLWFAGKRDTVIEPGATAVTDYLSLTSRIPANVRFWIRTFVSVNSGQTWQQGGTLDGGASGEFAVGSAGETDKTTASLLAGTYTRPYGPCAVLLDDQPTNTLRLYGVGDSILNGQGDTVPRRGWWSWLTHPATGTRVQAQRVAVPGERAADLLLPGGFRNRLTYLADGCNAAVLAMGTNDYAVTTLQQMQTNHIAIANALIARGMKVWAATLLPRVTSTDYTTVEGQTPFATDGVRIQFNEWLRTNPAPFTGYLEVADIGESSRNSGRWKVTGAANYATADGTHPSAVMHQIIGQTLTLQPFYTALGVTA